MSIKNMWEDVRTMVKSLKRDSEHTFKEIWLPGFKIEEKDLLVKGFVGGRINKKTIVEVALYLTLIRPQN